MRGDNPTQAQIDDASDTGSINAREDNSSNASVISASDDVHPIIRPMSPPVNIQPIVQMPVDELRALIKEEIQMQSQNRTEHRSTNIQTEPEIINPPPIGQLSPASLALDDHHAIRMTSATTVQPPAHDTVFPPLQQQFASLPTCSNQGNQFSSVDLPPISTNILKPIQNKEYVNFNSLLPSSLYDYNANQTTLNLQINPDNLSDNNVALSAIGNKKVKINSVASWMQAWNLYIRAMVNYHPKSAPELLV